MKKSDSEIPEIPEIKAPSFKIRVLETADDVSSYPSGGLAEKLAGLLPQVSSSFSGISDEELAGVVGSGSLNSGGSLIFLAEVESSETAAGEENPKIVGSLTLVFYATPTGKKSRIEDVVVDEKYRGMGIGLELSKSAIQKAGELGASTVDLTSRPDREAANEMYKKLGFELRETNVYRKDLP